MNHKTRLQIRAAVVVVISVVLFGNVFAQGRRELIGLVGQTLTGIAITVTDGDTIRVRLDKTQQMVPIRIEGIDAPERGEAFSDRARNAMRALVFDKQVQLRATDVDNYNRLVA